MEYKVVEERSSARLTAEVNKLIEAGWKPFGSHHVVTVFKQNRFSGMQIHSTTYNIEYSQTMIKE